MFRFAAIERRGWSAPAPTAVVLLPAVAITVCQCWPSLGWARSKWVGVARVIAMTYDSLPHAKLCYFAKLH